MSSEKQIVILTGQEAKNAFEDSDLIHLTNRVNKLEIEDSTGKIRHETALHIHALKIDEGLKHQSIRNIDRAFYPIEHMKGLRADNQVAIAKDSEKTVGMAGFEHCGTDAVSGKEVYEVRRVGVRKEYEKRKIGTRLHGAMFQKIREFVPNALILVEAQDTAMIKICENIGYVKCEARRGLAIKYGANEVEDNLDWFEKSGGQFLLFDPSAH